MDFIDNNNLGSALRREEADIFLELPDFLDAAV
jgi:hypothetical protein